MDHIARIETPLGGMLAAADGDALVWLWFENEEQYNSSLLRGRTGGRPEIFKMTSKWLYLYFSGRDPGFTPPVALKGSEFELLVWKALMEIPFGQTATYGEIASLIERMSGRPSVLPRAVGRTIGRNPISLIIPCHRVIGADGRLTGYAGGLWRKERLLALEGAVISDGIVKGRRET